jgi:hypothetical protein
MQPPNPTPLVAKLLERSRFWTPVAVLPVFVATWAAYLPAIRGDAAHITAARLRTTGGLFWLDSRLGGGSVLGCHMLNLDVVLRQAGRSDEAAAESVASGRTQPWASSDTG